jgi:hypothetical protein
LRPAALNLPRRSGGSLRVGHPTYACREVLNRRRHDPIRKPLLDGAERRGVRSSGERLRCQRGADRPRGEHANTPHDRAPWPIRGRRCADRSPPTLKAMCLRVFILSDKPLPASVRTRGCSVDSVQLAPEWKAFSSSLAHAAEFTVGGCACALIPSAAHRRAAGHGPSTPPCQLLGAVLDRALVDRRRLRLLIAWAGRESDAPTAIGDITVGDIAEGRLPLSECVSGAPLTGRVVAPTQVARALKSSR